MHCLSEKKIKNIVSDLCSEDDWGSWELWWRVSADVSDKEKENLKHMFIDVISAMVVEGELIAKLHKLDGKCYPVRFSREKLTDEINAAHDPQPEGFFWFGTK